MSASAFALYAASIRTELSGSAPSQSKQAAARWRALSNAEKQREGCDIPRGNRHQTWPIIGYAVLIVDRRVSRATIQAIND